MVTTLTSLSIPKINSGPPNEEYRITDQIIDHTVGRETVTKTGVKVRPVNLGKVIIKGEPIDIGGPLVEWTDFELQYKSTSSTVCNVKGAGAKFERNKIRFGNATTGKNHWLYIGANDVLFQGNDFAGKVGLGNQILVGSATVATGVKVLNNHINGHQKGSLAETNGYEMVRIGESSVGKQTFGCEFAGNILENYTAPDSESMTVKSSGNKIHDNVFRNNAASLTLRHGRLNDILNNIFEGCGLRIYGKGHNVKGNKFKRNPNGQLRQIVVGNGVYAEEEQNTTASYTQVRDMAFEDNWIEMEDSTDNIIFQWADGSGSLKPINNHVKGNKIVASKGILANAANVADWNGNEISGNTLWCEGTAKYGNMPISGYEKKDPRIVIPPPPPPPPPAVLTIETLDERLRIVEQKLGL